MVRSSRAAEFPRAVAVACDINHLPYALFAATRIARTERARRFDICICVPEGTDTGAAERFPEIRVCELALPDLSAYPRSARISSATYIRCFMPEIFAGDYDRLLYIDTDIYQVRDGLGEVFGLDLGDAIIAAAPDQCTASPLRLRRRQGYLRRLGITDGRYFNAGVLLMDVRACLDFGLAGRLLAEMAANAGELKYHDQSALNRICAGRTAWMSIRWNWPFNYRLAPALDYVDPLMIHFLAGKKPWLATERPELLPFFREYEAFLRREFPGHVIRDNPKDAIRRARSAVGRGLARLRYGATGALSALTARRNWDLQKRHIRTVFGADLG